MTFDPLRNPSDELALSQGCYFDEAQGERVIRFVERFCRQSKGRWAGQPLTLLDWQKDFLLRLFGWRRPGGLRRFARAYLEVAKKNGKSTMLSALAVYLLIGDKEGAPEVYLNAVDREQASIIFDEAARMIAKSPELAGRLEVIKSKKRITDPVGNGKIVANSADVPSKDGVNASGIIFDELHRQKTRELWDIFEYAGASREQPLKISITTAGEEADGVWHEQREFSDKVNAGVIPDISHLGVVYRAFEEDDIDDPETWKKANPSLGITLKEEDFARELAEAKVFPAKLANFRRLRLNIITRGDSAFCKPEDWEACFSTVRPDAGQPWYGGLDLAQNQDLAAFVRLTCQDDLVYVTARFWLPEENIEELERQHQVPYRTWADQGFIELTPGNVIDYSFIRAEVGRMGDSGGCLKILTDPWRAEQLGLQLREEDGFPIETVRQGFESLGGPTGELQRLILGKKLRHDGNPILKWHLSNAVAEQDAAGLIKLSKRKSKKKIDGAAALVNAVAAFTSDENGGRSVYETRGILHI